jgi:hypothetical protein
VGDRTRTGDIQIHSLWIWRYKTLRRSHFRLPLTRGCTLVAQTGRNCPRTWPDSSTPGRSCQSTSAAPSLPWPTAASDTASRCPTRAGRGSSARCRFLSWPAHAYPHVLIVPGARLSPCSEPPQPAHGPAEAAKSGGIMRAGSGDWTGHRPQTGPRNRPGHSLGIALVRRTAFYRGDLCFIQRERAYSRRIRPRCASSSSPVRKGLPYGTDAQRPDLLLPGEPGGGGGGMEVFRNQEARETGEFKKTEKPKAHVCVVLAL